MKGIQGAAWAWYQLHCDASRSAYELACDANDRTSALVSADAHGEDAERTAGLAAIVLYAFASKIDLQIHAAAVPLIGGGSAALSAARASRATSQILINLDAGQASMKVVHDRTIEAIRGIELYCRGRDNLNRIVQAIVSEAKPSTATNGADLRLNGGQLDEPA